MAGFCTRPVRPGLRVAKFEERKMYSTEQKINVFCLFKFFVGNAY